MEKLNIKVIIGSTRVGRFSEKPAQWIFEEVKKMPDVEAELLDLRDYPMPFYDNAKTPKQLKGVFDNDVVKKWAGKIEEADGFIIVSPEYNHGYSAVLKNALDHIFFEWNNKAVGFVSYGSVGGARNVEQLRQVSIELQMTPIRNAVHIFSHWLLLDEKGNLKDGAFADYEVARKALIEQLIWHARALKNARL